MKFADNFWCFMLSDDLVNDMHAWSYNLLPTHKINFHITAYFRWSKFTPNTIFLTLLLLDVIRRHNLSQHTKQWLNSTLRSVLENEKYSYNWVFCLISLKKIAIDIWFFGFSIFIHSNLFLNLEVETLDNYSQLKSL